MKTTITINEARLKNIISEIVDDILFKSLPKQDLCGTMDWALLNGKPYIIKEGLIKTYPEQNVIDSLVGLFGLYNTTNKDNVETNRALYYLDVQKLEEYNGIITLNKSSQNKTKRIDIIVNTNDFNQNDFDRYLLKYGWFCSFSQRLDGYNSLIRYVYEKKFDINVTDYVNEKKELFHICPNIFLNKINKVGLKPKVSSWNQFSNPERIYFFLKQPTHKEFVKWSNNFYGGKKFPYQEVGGWSLLKINVTSLTNNPSFYYDPRMKDGVYTTDSISPQSIEIIDYNPQSFVG